MKDEFNSLALRIEFRTTPEQAKILMALFRSITIEQMMSVTPQHKDHMKFFKAYRITADMFTNFMESVDQAVYEARNSYSPGGA